jgi:uncharacterized membrane protein
MKKIMLAAAMCAAFAAQPAFADTLVTNEKVSHVIKCTVLLLTPECIEFWKAHHEEDMAKWEAMKSDWEAKMAK